MTDEYVFSNYSSFLKSDRLPILNNFLNNLHSESRWPIRLQNNWTANLLFYACRRFFRKHLFFPCILSSNLNIGIERNWGFLTCPFFIGCTHFGYSLHFNLSLLRKLIEHRGHFVVKILLWLRCFPPGNITWFPTGFFSFDKLLFSCSQNSFDLFFTI